MCPDNEVTYAASPACMSKVHDYRGYTDAKLYEFIYGYVSHSDEHVSAHYELNRRHEHKEFLVSNVVSWVALAFAFIFLLISVVKFFTSPVKSS